MAQSGQVELDDIGGESLFGRSLRQVHCRASAPVGQGGRRSKSERRLLGWGWGRHTSLVLHQ